MKKQLKDFFIGVGSVLDINPTAKIGSNLDLSKDDMVLIGEDFEQVGDDLRDAISRCSNSNVYITANGMRNSDLAVRLLFKSFRKLGESDITYLNLHHVSPNMKDIKSGEDYIYLNECKDINFEN